jgi:hypothetical protein
VHEVGVYGLLQGKAPPISRVSIIYECLNYVTKYLESTLNLSLEDMADWTTMDWRSLNFGIMISTKSSIILDSAYLSTEASQCAEWLERCIDTFCLRARELHNQTGNESSLFQKMSVDWAQMKIYHHSCVQRSLVSGETMTAASSLPHQSHGQQQYVGLPPDPESSHIQLEPFNELFWSGFVGWETQLSDVF